MASVPESPFFSGEKPAFPSLEKKNHRPTPRKFLRWGGGIFLFIGLVLGGYLVWRQNGLGPAQDAAVDVASESGTFTADLLGQPSGNAAQVSETAPEENLGAGYASENFRIGDVAIGGEAIFVMADETPEPLVLSGVRGESFMDRDGRAKVAISWTTNKLALSEISYGRGRGELRERVSESDYAFNHSVILSDLDPGSIYTYAIESKDRSGGTISSDTYAIFTSSEEVSLFDLIASAVGEVFGWTVSQN